MEKDFSKIYANETKNENDDFKIIADFYVNSQEADMLDQMFNDYTYSINRNVTKQETKMLLSKARRGKSPGIDNLPYEIFQNDTMCLILTQFFQLCLDYGHVPRPWLNAIIVPIPKSSSSNPCDPLSYRGISLLCASAKLCSSLLNSRLLNFLDRENILADEQNGFRADRSCLDHVFTLYTIVTNRIGCKLNTFVAFIDLKKAFDFVDRRLLLYKLLKIGISGKLYFAIKSLLQSTKSCVRINDEYTNFFPVESGVRQGDTNSPTLFAIFINNLVLEINNLKLGIPIDNSIISCLLYADDLALIAGNEPDLQSMLSCLCNWCQKWNIHTNINKSNIVHFRPVRRKQSEYIFMLKNDKIKYVDCYKYLGIYFDANLKMVKAISTLADSGSRAYGAILSKYKLMSSMGFDTYLKLFDACISPILDYCSPVWSKFNCTKLDDIQNRSMRTYMGVNRYAPKLAVAGDMGWVPGTIRRKIQTLRYWNHLINLPNDRLTKRVFLYDYNTNSEASWCSHIRQIFIENGMENIYNMLLVCDLNVAKFTLLTKYTESWKSDISHKPKLRFYTKFKSEPLSENYLKLNLSCSQRSYFAQLRLGILQIGIETGRYRSIPVKERLCDVCKSSNIEDELHFLFKCPKYDDYRATWFTKMNLSLKLAIDVPDNLNLLLPIIFHHVRPRANYVTNCMKRRNNLIFK